MKLTVENFNAECIKDLIKSWSRDKKGNLVKFAASNAVVAGADYLVIAEDAYKADCNIDASGNVEDYISISNYIIAAVDNVEANRDKVKQQIIDYINK